MVSLLPYRAPRTHSLFNRLVVFVWKHFITNTFHFFPSFFRFSAILQLLYNVFGVVTSSDDVKLQKWCDVHELFVMAIKFHHFIELCEWTCHLTIVTRGVIDNDDNNNYYLIFFEHLTNRIKLRFFLFFFMLLTRFDPFELITRLTFAFPCIRGEKNR